MNERFLPGMEGEHTGQIKIGVIKIEDLLERSQLTFDLCDLLDTCFENEQN